MSRPRLPSPTPRALVALLAAAGLAGLLAPPAAGVPLRVRARTTLEAESARRHDGLAVRGTLLDDGGRPLARAAVLADVTGLAPRSVLTGADGRFEILLGDDDLRALDAEVGDRLPWAVRYGGDASFGPAEAGGTLDLRREPTSLRVTVDPEVASLDAPSIALRVAVRSGAEAIGSVPIRLRVAGGPELLGDTDPAGDVIFLLRPDGLGRAGTFPVRVRFDGDTRYAPSQARAEVRLRRPSRVTLRVAREGGAHLGRYRFSGRLSDDRGPVPGASVALVTRHVTEGAPPGPEESQALTTTGADGVFLVALPVRHFASLRRGVLEVRAVYQPGDGEHEPAESRAARIPIPGPPSVPARWYAAALAAGLGVVLLVLAVRLRFWEEIALAWARRAARRGEDGDEPAPDVLPPLVSEPARGAHRRPDRVAGRVVDAHSGARVAGARVTLRAEGGVERVARTGRDGAFAEADLPPGAWTLRLEARGYLARETRLSVPHDGGLDGATLALVSVRGRVRDLFAQALRRADTPLRWGHDTPAEAEARARAGRAPRAAALAPLRALVEAVWFGPAEPTPEQARRAEELLRDLDGPA